MVLNRPGIWYEAAPVTIFFTILRDTFAFLSIIRCDWWGSLRNSLIMHIRAADLPVHAAHKTLNCSHARAWCLGNASTHNVMSYARYVWNLKSSPHISHVRGCVYNNQGGGVVSRALLAMLYACVIVSARGVTQVVLTVGAGGSSQESHTCIVCPIDNMLRTSYETAHLIWNGGKWRASETQQTDASYPPKRRLESQYLLMMCTSQHKSVEYKAPNGAKARVTAVSLSFVLSHYESVVWSKVASAVHYFRFGNAIRWSTWVVYCGRAIILNVALGWPQIDKPAIIQNPRISQSFPIRTLVPPEWLPLFEFCHWIDNRFPNWFVSVQ